MTSDARRFDLVGNEVVTLAGISRFHGVQYDALERFAGLAEHAADAIMQGTHANRSPTNQCRHAAREVPHGASLAALAT
ncbi:UNVERIFIED_ORG: hypothetical protein GGD48_004935 [Rhizobium etli]